MLGGWTGGEKDWQVRSRSGHSAASGRFVLTVSWNIGIVQTIERHEMKTMETHFVRNSYSYRKLDCGETNLNAATQVSLTKLVVPRV